MTAPLGEGFSCRVRAVYRRAPISEGKGMKKQLIAGAVALGVVTTGMVGTAGSASAVTLPTQQVAAHDSLTTATVVSAGAQPQFWHAVVQAAANAVAGAAALKAVQVTYNLLPKSSSSSESSSSSSGGPAASTGGSSSGDAQFDAAQ
jgi:hypothetical protein